MKILSHRGYWKSKSEQNTLEAFKRSFELGFGLETDIRDFDRRLVVSHDMATAACPSFESFLELYQQIGRGLPLALNVKSDGLQGLMKDLLARFGVENYFAFDASVPDTLGYLRSGLRFFTRQSELEQPPALYDQAEGVWLDEFHGHWITAETILGHLQNGKKACLVSPELHKRPHLEVWKDYARVAALPEAKELMICTDYPEEAREYFNG